MNKALTFERLCTKCSVNGRLSRKVFLLQRVKMTGRLPMMYRLQQGDHQEHRKEQCFLQVDHLHPVDSFNQVDHVHPVGCIGQMGHFHHPDRVHQVKHIHQKDLFCLANYFLQADHLHRVGYIHQLYHFHCQQWGVTA